MNAKSLYDIFIRSYMPIGNHHTKKLPAQQGVLNISYIVIKKIL